MRYYYTDPLAAAWMAKKHGMRFITDDNMEFPLEYLMEGVTDKPGGMKYIHPDSLHLLEPREGDILGQRGSTLVGYYDGWKVVQPVKGYEIGNDKVIPKRAAKIIQRNGLAFHWPEKLEENTGSGGQ